MTIDTLIFDMDDVLFDYDLDARLDHLARLSGRLPQDIHHDIWASGFEDEADAGGWPDSDEYLKEFGRRLGYALSRGEWVEARRCSMTPFSDMLELVGDLRKTFQVAVLTNNVPLLRETLDEAAPEIRPLFGRSVYFSCDFKLAKPDTRLFAAVAGECERAPEQCLFTDDKAENAEGANQSRHDRHSLHVAGAVQASIGRAQHNWIELRLANTAVQRP